jgi:hypothetical protein
MSPPRQPDDGPIDLPLAELARLLTIDPRSCPDAEIAEAVVALVGLSDRVEEALIRWLGVFDGRGIHHGDGSRHAGAWLATRAEISRSTAAGKVRTADDLESCPLLAAAFHNGHLGAAKVRAALHARQTWPELFTEHEPTIVEEITPLTVDQAHTVLRRWAQMAQMLKDSRNHDSDGSGESKGHNPHLDNQLHLSTTFAGNVTGDLTFDPVAGTELTEAITARVDHLYNTGVFGPDDGLTPANRRAYALRDLICDGTTPTSRQGKPRPSISLHLDQRTAQGQPIDSIDDLLTRRCELTNGTPITISTAQRLLCNCTLTTLVHKTLQDGHIEIIGITDTLRDATWRQRQALATRDGGCTFPGCHTPPERCHAHHIHSYEHGGPTLTHNLALVCNYHHHLLHEGQWHLTRDATTNELQLTKPDRTPIPLTPHGHKITQPPTPPPTEPPPAHPPPN